MAKDDRERFGTGTTSNRIPRCARRRWHVSLSSFLRDDPYVPLGGNRRGPTRTYVNLLIVMLLGGLWHGGAAMRRADVP